MTETEVLDRVPEWTEFGPINERLDVSYETLERGEVIGVGGNATVYETTLPDGLAVALKEPHLDPPVPERICNRFEDEITAWRRVCDHPSIVALYAAGTDPQPWLALEHITGGSLETHDSAPIETLWMGVCLADALAHAHTNGVAHLDITPGNVLLRETDSDTWPVPALTDWGVGILLEKGAANLEGLSPQYGAPEQFAPDQFGAPDERTDIYQLGTVLYEALTGDLPFTGPPAKIKEAVLEEPPAPATGMNPALPVATDDVLDCALAKDPADRYESAVAFGNALAKVFADTTGHEIGRRPGASQGTTAGDSPVDTAGSGRHPRAAAYDRAITLNEQGFAQVTEQYFARREPASLIEAWRRGLDLVDVHAGHAVARDPPATPGHDDGPFVGTEASTMAQALVETLRDGSDCAVLGPPGSGKSTVCKRVACEWNDRDLGPVFYRESGSTAFDDPAELLREIARIDREGQALVVVEDAVRPDAQAAFELLDRVHTNEEVAFLADAREQEWRTAGGDTTGMETDPITEGKRRLKTAFVPRPDQETSERFIERATTAIGDAPEFDPAQFAEDVRRARATAEADDAAPGELFYLIHRLTALIQDPLAEEPTTLTERVREVRDDLAAAGESALDVGMAVNLLNAAGIGVHPELVYAVAPEDPVSIDDAVDILDGRVVFPRETDWSTDNEPYPAVHEAWSAEYLAGCLEAAGEEAARERFGRVLNCLLAVAADSERRARVAEALHGQTPYLDRIATAPQDWVEDTVEQLLEFGDQQPRFAPLFGTTETAAYDLPEVCPDQMRQELVKRRGRFHQDRGAYDAARAEYERALERAQAAGNQHPQADNLGNLGGMAALLSEYDAAREYYTESLAIFREIGDRHGEAASLGGLGGVALHQGEFAAAREYYKESLAIFREVGDRQGESYSLNNLGLLLNEQSEYEAAQEHFQESLAIKGEIGDRQGEANSLQNLGEVAKEHGEYEAAREYLQESLAIYRETGYRVGEAESLGELGEVAQEQGEYETVQEYLEKSLAICREIGYRGVEAIRLQNLGTVAQETGEYDMARERYETAIDIYGDIGAVRDELEAIEHRAQVAVETNTREGAVEWCERGLARIQETDLDELDEQREKLEEIHPER